MLGGHFGLVLHPQRCRSDLTFRTIHDLEKTEMARKLKKTHFFPIMLDTGFYVLSYYT